MCSQYQSEKDCFFITQVSGSWIKILTFHWRKRICFVLRSAYELIFLQLTPERTTSCIGIAVHQIVGAFHSTKNCGLNLWRIPILSFHSQIINDVIYVSMQRIFCGLYCNILAGYCWFSSDHCPWFIVIGVIQKNQTF